VLVQCGTEIGQQKKSALKTRRERGELGLEHRGNLERMQSQLSLQGLGEINLRVETRNLQSHCTKPPLMGNRVWSKVSSCTRTREVGALLELLDGAQAVVDDVVAKGIFVDLDLVGRHFAAGNVLRDFPRPCLVVPADLGEELDCGRAVLT
jgi:hypothetical protein